MSTMSTTEAPTRTPTKTVATLIDLTPTQIVCFLVVASADHNVTTGEVGNETGFGWHAANAALRSLQTRGFVQRFEVSKTYRALKIVGLQISAA